MKLADRISTILIMALCIFFFIEASSFSPLSGLFPRVVLIILATLALLQFILTFTRKKEDEEFDKAAFRHIPSLLSLTLMIGWTVFIPVLGFLVSALIFFPAITIYLDRGAPAKKLWGRLAISWGLTVAFWFFFTKVLYVPFPTGLLL